MHRYAMCPSIARAAVVCATVCGAWCAAAYLGAADAVSAQLPTGATVFVTTELDLTFSGELAFIAELPDDQVHDAYDADREGTWARVQATFTPDAGNPGEAITVPAFAMRDQRGGPWRWRVRWSPQRAGAWRVALHGAGAMGARSGDTGIALPGTILASVEPGIAGPLVAPSGSEHPAYLRSRESDGGTRARWLFGACRAWVVASDPAVGGWAACEGIDRDRDLLPMLRENGFDLLNQWMAPWEFLLVHCDRAEHWRGDDGGWAREPLPAAAAWMSWSSYDQGRAKAFDRLVASCEGSAGKPTVRMLLSPLPHQCFQMKSHAWGRNESGWSVADDGGASAPAKLNGFSAFHAGDAWSFFAADPRVASDDWRARLFDYQADYVRYLIARWGSSRALGLWVLIDELDGVGDEHGIMALKTGWWAHPDCSRWLADMVRLMRGSLSRADGLAYAGDPFHHPLHAATTSIGSEFAPEGNIAWDGGPLADARPDVVGWHWYPTWPSHSTYKDVWNHVIDGVAAFSSRPGAGGQARLISEFGAADRGDPSDAPSALYPTLYHHGIWAAVFSGESGTVMDWDDGKEFGEARWRAGAGPFDHDHYPVDNAAQLRALRVFLAGLDPDRLRPPAVSGETAPRVTGVGGVRAFALATRDARPELHGWFFAGDATGGIAFDGLPAGRYRATWFDPWTGAAALVEPTPVVVEPGRAAVIDVAPILRALTPREAFPKANREDRGRDAAFRLVPVAP